MSDEDSKRYEMLFMQTDTNQDGVVTGQECFPVFMQWVPLGLPQEALKEVWDLVAGQKAQLNQHDFKTCLYLMESVLKGTIATLPSSLPPQPFPPLRASASKRSTSAVRVSSSFGRRSGSFAAECAKSESGSRLETT